MLKKANQDELQIIKECLNGNVQAYGELMLLYQDRLYHSLYRFLGCTEDASDVLQDAFLNAYMALKDFQGGSRFFTWLYRIAMNLAIDHRRKQRKHESIQQVMIQAGQRNDKVQFDNPMVLAERNEDVERIQKSLLKLSKDHRLVLVLKDLDGLRYEEIAEILAIPIGTVRSRIHRARLELKTIIDAAAPAQSKSSASE